MAGISKLFSFASLALYLTLFNAIASASPIDQIRRDFTTQLEANKELNKRADTVAVTGVQDGQTATRLSLRVMAANNPDQFTLYLLAMHNFQAMDQNQLLSYYDVASIHGVPAKPWDGVQGSFDANGAPGYCTHSSPIFPGWHRAYMALFEQAFYAQAQATVNSFKDASARSRYQKALVGLRLPYFDWAQGPGKASTVVPSYMTDKMISVPNPAGGQQTIINPLFRFDHHPLDRAGMYMDPWDFWPTTLRYPTASNTQNVVSQNNLFVGAVQNNAQSLKDSVYNLLTQCSSYMEFSNDQNKFTSPGCHTSLESVHNLMHTLIGGSNKGHMTYLWWSAFDPAFWIHHVNVDRLFAMWQVLYPNSYTIGGNALANTYTQKAPFYVNADSPLQPFHRDTKGTSWTSTGVRNMNVFKYTYTEVQQAGNSAANMRNIVNSLYGGASASNAKRGLLDGLLKDVQQDIQQGVTDTLQSFSATPASAPVVNNVLNALPGLNSDLRKLLTPTGRKHEYVANILAQRWGLDGSFTVFTFLGNHTTDPHQMPFDPNMVGQFGVFSNPGMTPNADNPLIVAGSVPLTTALVTKVQNGELKSLKKSDVMPYLKKNLSWAVASGDGQLISNDQVPGLSVKVVRSSVTPASSDFDFPSWQGFEDLPDYLAM